MVKSKISKAQLALYKRIEGMIFTLRGEKVILDSDLAAIYGVTTARLNQQIKRNKERFPDDFLFTLNKKEFDDLMLQIATSNPVRGGRRKLPFVFTEHGTIMVANILNSSKAVQMSVLVVRAFVQIRRDVVAYSELHKRLIELEQKVVNHDNDIRAIVEAIRQLMAPPEKSKRPFGFNVEERKLDYSTGMKK
ncbi:MAG: ORF6N domain-containing protein [Melioribacteraceae bacterium]